MSNANTPAMMAQSMAESLIRENKALKEQNALLTVQVQRLETAIAPLAECHLPPDGCENLGVTAHFYTGEVVAAKAALTALPQQVKSEDASSPKPSLTERRTDEQNGV